MILVTAAKGEECRKEVLDLYRSLRVNRWRPSLHVISDEPISVPHNRVIPMESNWGGRGYKSQFANLLPDLPEDEPVSWVDTDCLVCGSEPAWEPLPPHSVAGVPLFTLGPNLHLPVHKAQRMHEREGIYYTSFFLQFDSLATARLVCSEWHKHLEEDKKKRSEQLGSPGDYQHDTDEIALSNALHSLAVNRHALSSRHNGTRVSAYPTLLHKSNLKVTHPYHGHTLSTD